MPKGEHKGKCKVSKKDSKAMRMRAKGRKFTKYAGKVAKGVKTGPKTKAMMSAGNAMGAGL